MLATGRGLGVVLALIVLDADDFGLVLAPRPRLILYEHGVRGSLINRLRQLFNLLLANQLLLDHAVLAQVRDRFVRVLQAGKLDALSEH